MLIRRQLDVAIACVCSLFVASAVICLSTTPALAQDSSRNAQTLIPLEGLDPVLLSQGKEVQGDMKYKVTRGQFEYIFANADTKAEFEKDPARYEIQLNGSCARMGPPTTGNPDLHAVHNGRIYIFGSAECQTLFKAAPEKYLEVPAAPKSPPTPEMIKRGAELVGKAVEALGGAAKLDQLISFQRKDTRKNEVKNTLLLTFPDGLRQETIRPTFTLISVITPSESFFVVNNAARPMPETNRIAIHKELNRELIVLFRARTRPDFKAWHAGRDKEGDVELVEVKLGEFTTMLRIDPVTGRVLNQTYRGRGPGSMIGEIVMSYSDFRSVEGLSLPFKITSTFDGQPFPELTATIEAITINEKIDPSRFKKPDPQSVGS